MANKYRGKYKKCRACKHAIEPMNALVEVKSSCSKHVNFSGFLAVVKQTCEECEQFEQRTVINLEKSILLKTWEVQAILNNGKSQKRIVVPERLLNKYYEYDEYCDAVMPRDIPCTRSYEKDFFMNYVPYQVGDILWVKETWCDVGTIYKFPTNYIYKASPELCPENCPYAFNGKWHDSSCLKPTWKTSIHMPKEAARIWLKVTDVRVERLEEISWEDMKAEGFKDTVAFLNDWDKNHKEPYQFCDDIWVWVITFERTEKK